MKSNELREAILKAGQVELRVKYKGHTITTDVYTPNDKQIDAILDAVIGSLNDVVAGIPSYKDSELYEVFIDLLQAAKSNKGDE